MYNRRQKVLWVEKEMQKLQDAKAAYASGSATPEQLELIKNEEIGEIMKRKKEEAKAQRPWNRAKEYLFGGLKQDETPSDVSSKVDGAADNKVGVLEALSAKAAEDYKLRTAAETAPVPAQPGQLDILAENVETAAKQSTQSWKSWFFGR
jgi:phage terminase small subunit